MYQAVFSSKAKKSLRRIPKKDQRRIKRAILALEKNPFCFGTIKPSGFPLAQYRHRVGNYRILFDLWEEKEVLMILDIERRTSTTY